MAEKKHRHLQFKLRSKNCVENGRVAIPVDVKAFFLPPQKRSEFNGFPQRVNGGVGYLTGVQHQMIPVNPVGKVAPHTGENDSPGLGLFVEIAEVMDAPVGIRPKAGFSPHHVNSLGRTQGDAALAPHTACLIAQNGVAFVIPAVHVMNTLAYTHLTANAPAVIPHNLKLWKEQAPGHR
jgi:hypothetical protein